MLKCRPCRPAAHWRLCSSLFLAGSPQRIAYVTNTNTQPLNGTESSALREYLNQRSCGARQSGIRSRLQQWELEHLDDVFPVLRLMATEKPGEITNEVASIQNNASEHVPSDDEYNDNGYIGHEVLDDLVDFGGQRSFLVPGDLVELRSMNGPRVELAILVRQIGQHAQFYSMSGKWILQRPHLIKFFVPGFVDPEALKPLLSFLPGEKLSAEKQQDLWGGQYSLPRSVGGPLIRRMLDFWSSAGTVQRDAADEFDKAHLLSHPTKTQHLGLRDIARLVLVKGDDEELEPHVLYAVHRALLQDPLVFQAQDLPNHRVWSQFTITSGRDIKTCNEVTRIVRSYQDHLATKPGSKERKSHVLEPDVKQFIEFLSTARSMIGKSRSVRDCTQYGILAPRPGMAVVHPLGQSKFSEADRKYLDFFEIWCGYRLFSVSSHLNATGSAILRLIDRYDNMQLDQSAGWTFLQEIGRIPLSATRAVYGVELDLPHLLEPDGEELGILSDDHLQALRGEPMANTIYCIDDVGAKEIDDGISFEPAGQGNSWVHIHAADPASQIKPDSNIANNAAYMAQNVYFPDQMRSMLPTSVVQEHFSLAPGRPCLTFSAKLNEHGKLLEYRIRASTVGRVVYLTPATFAAIADLSQPAPLPILDIGDEPIVHGAPRVITILEDLHQDDAENLKSLARLSLASGHERALNGAISFQRASVVPSVGHGTDSVGDKSIHLNAQGDLIHAAGDLVANYMLLAGNVAAKWCAERHIPTVFRSSQRNSTQNDPRHFFRQHMFAIVEKKQPIPAHLLDEYLSLSGPVLPSSIPGPHIAIGLDIYSKATSPLRRYGDLVTHWQIEAALLAEHRHGTSLAGSDISAKMPFSKDAIDTLIPWLDNRERTLRRAQRAAERSWVIQALIRAHFFKQTPLPPSFEMVIRTVNRFFVNGNIPSLGNFSVTFDMPSWLEKLGARPGTKLEVEIKDLNAYKNTAVMNPLRLLSV